MPGLKSKLAATAASSFPRRLNVAITRGRHAVWVLGSAATLTRGQTTWATLVAEARARSAYIEATQLPSLRAQAVGAANSKAQLLHLFNASVWQVR
jgi:hypothetical protein